jgi:hypothetical protein
MLRKAEHRTMNLCEQLLRKEMLLLCDENPIYPFKVRWGVAYFHPKTGGVIFTTGKNLRAMHARALKARVSPGMIEKLPLGLRTALRDNPHLMTFASPDLMHAEDLKNRLEKMGYVFKSDGGDKTVSRDVWIATHIDSGVYLPLVVPSSHSTPALVFSRVLGYLSTTRLSTNGQTNKGAQQFIHAYAPSYKKRAQWKLEKVAERLDSKTAQNEAIDQQTAKRHIAGCLRIRKILK